MLDGRHRELRAFRKYTSEKRCCSAGGLLQDDLHRGCCDVIPIKTGEFTRDSVLLQVGDAVVVDVPATVHDVESRGREQIQELGIPQAIQVFDAMAEPAMPAFV